MPRGSVILLSTLCLLLLAAVARNPAAQASSPTYKVPSGSYMATCTDCTLGTGTSFSCTCNNRNHSPVATTINLSNCANGDGGFYSLTNNDGKLTCDVYGSSSPTSMTSAIKIPAGSYAKTCNNCTISGGNYSCACENGSNMIEVSSTINFGKCPKDANGFNQLVNQYGTLICS